MKGVLINFDEKGYKSHLDNFASLAKRFEGIISLYNSLNVGAFANTKEEFCLLLLNSEIYLFESIMKEKQTEINGMQLNKEKIFELLQKPKAYYEILTESEKILISLADWEKTSLSNSSPYTPKEIIYFFDFKEDGTISLKASKKIEFKEDFEVYATSETAKDIFYVATKICEFINESGVIKKANSPSKKIGCILECITIPREIDGQLSVDPSKVKWYNSH